MLDPFIAWQRLRAGNERMSALHGHRAGASAGPPTAVVFRCADSAVASETVFGQSVGSLIEVSTWGQVVDTGVLAGMEHALETLAVPLIVVLGHPGCRAISTAVRAWNDAELPEGATRAVIERVFGSIVRRGAGADSVDDVATAHITDTGLSLLARSPLIARRVNAGTCGIVCATTRAGDGRIQTYATVGSVGESAEGLLECV